MATRTIEVNIIAKNLAGEAFAGLNKSLSDSEKKVNSLSEKLQSMGGRLQGIGTKMSLGITAPLSFLGGTAIDAASDLSESMNKVNVVFGQSSEKIQKFADSAAKNLGLSERSALEAAGTFGNLFTTMGLAQPTAADMSTAILSLSSDLASFNNLKPEEVLERLRSGLVGEVEPLRALGINLNAAAVEAKAMEMGLVGADGELTEAAKVQARYALILEQTKNAQGDFARTSDGLANSTRIAKAQFSDLQAEMGTKLLPAATKIMVVLSSLLDKFSALPEPVQTLVFAVGGLAAVAGPAAGGLGTMMKVAGELGGPLGKLGPVIMKNVVPALGSMNLALGPIGWTILAIGAALALLVTAWTQNWGDIQGKTKAAVDWIGARLTDLVNFFTDLPNKLAALIGSIGETAGNIGSAIRDGIIGGIKGTMGAIGNLGEQLLSALKGLINSAVDAVNNAIPDDIGFDILGQHIGVDLPDNPIPHLAGGVSNFRGGLALLGEQGPELAALPAGTTVFSNQQTRQIMGGSVNNHNRIIVNIFGGNATAVMDRFATHPATREFFQPRARF